MSGRFDQRNQHVTNQVNIIQQPDGSVLEQTWFVLPLADAFRGPAAYGSGTDAFTAAPPMVWAAVAGVVHQRLQPWLDDGWSLIEIPGPQHLLLTYRWHRRWGVILLAGLSKQGGSPDVTKWEAYAHEFRVLLSRRRPAGTVSPGQQSRGADEANPHDRWWEGQRPYK